VSGFGVLMVRNKSYCNPPPRYDGIAREMGKDHFYFGTYASAAAVWKERQCFVLSLVVRNSAACQHMPSPCSSVSAN
jgi:hypothetical protein